MQQQVAGYPLNLSEGNFVNPEANALLMAQTKRGKNLFKKAQLPLPPAPQHPHAAVAPGPLGQPPAQAAAVPQVQPQQPAMMPGQPQPQVQAASPTELTNKLVAEKYGRSGGKPLTVGEVEALDLKAHQLWNASQRQGMAQTVTLPAPAAAPQPLLAPPVAPVAAVPAFAAPAAAPVLAAAPVVQPQQPVAFAAAPAATFAAAPQPAPAAAAWGGALPVAAGYPSAGFY